MSLVSSSTQKILFRSLRNLTVNEGGRGGIGGGEGVGVLP